jgi:hypothetical protein
VREIINCRENKYLEEEMSVTDLKIIDFGLGLENEIMPPAEEGIGLNIGNCICPIINFGCGDDEDDD